jgi:hypothetical protein
MHSSRCVVAVHAGSNNNGDGMGLSGRWWRGRGWGDTPWLAGGATGNLGISSTTPRQLSSQERRTVVEIFFVSESSSVKYVHAAMMGCEPANALHSPLGRHTPKLQQ